MNFNAENSLAKATKIYSGGKIMSSANGAGPAASPYCLACALLPPPADILCSVICGIST